MSQPKNEVQASTLCQLKHKASWYLTNNKKARNILKSNFLIAAKKVSFSAWITLLEFPKFLNLAIWACREDRYNQEYKLIIKRIQKLVKTNGWNFTFKYLKECLRLVVQYLAGTPVTSKSRNAIGVRVNQYGLPVIIPAPLRKSLDLSEGNRITVRTVLTVLSIFRTFTTKVKPDLSSIISPFTGISPTLEIEGVIKSYFKGTFNLQPIKGFISESAGPIAKRATLGAPIDAFALLGYPRVALRVLQVLITSKGGLAYAISLLVLWLIYIVPFTITLVMFGKRAMLPIGRLSVVYDQAGKARIVALVNWWIQLSLLPLHRSLFDLLKKFETDGTHNQLAPLKLLMSRADKSHKFSCFDLSSATDRLPMQLQVRILNSFGVDGSLWKDLLTFPYFYKKEPVSYAVGQPMGAYSSWAMLAISHHVIVMLAASQAGIKGFNQYAVLGDDIVINNDLVAAEYLSIMKTLGVGINLSKSLLSSDFAEFAKRYVAPTFDISPIGAGNLLQVLRRPNMIGTLIIEMHSKSVFANFENGLIPLYKTFPFKRPFNEMVLWTYWMLCEALSSTQTTTLNGAAVNTSGELNDPDVGKIFSEELYAVLRKETLDDLRKAYHDAKNEEKFFWNNFYKIKAVKALSLRFYQNLGLFLSPALYLYWLALLTETETTRRKVIESALAEWKPAEVGYFLAYYSPVTISLRQSKKTMKDQSKYIKKVSKLYVELMSRRRY